MMTIDLAGQVVAVTGASSGIGEATALACARAGAAVALAARRAERIDALAERIGQEGGRAIAVQTDVGEEDQARAFVQRAQRGARPPGRARQQRRRDAARADRERPHRGVAADDPRQRLRRPLLQPRGPADHARAGLRAHRQRQLGRGTRSRGRARASTTSRSSASGAFSESLRQEGVAIGVRVTIIEPGAVATELPGHNRPEVLEQMAKRFAGVDAAGRRGHRRRDPLRDRPARQRERQRGADPPERPGGLSARTGRHLRRRLPGRGLSATGSCASCRWGDSGASQGGSASSRRRARALSTARRQPRIIVRRSATVIAVHGRLDAGLAQLADQLLQVGGGQAVDRRRLR